MMQDVMEVTPEPGARQRDVKEDHAPQGVLSEMRLQEKLWCE